MNDASFDEDMELDAEARALIEALRAEEELPADVHTRVWARIDEEIVERRGRSSGLWMVGGLAVAAALALVWIGGRTLRPDVRPASNMQAPFEAAAGTTEHAEGIDRRASAPAPRPPEEQVHSSEHGPRAALPELSPPPSVAADSDPRPSGSPGTRSRQASRVKTDDEVERPDDPLSEEMTLLKQAKLALSRGDATRSLTLLDQHAERFPRGALRQERDALRVVALCEEGELARGREAASRFLQEHAGAALAERVRAACRD